MRRAAISLIVVLLWMAVPLSSGTSADESNVCDAPGPTGTAAYYCEDFEGAGEEISGSGSGTIRGWTVDANGGTAIVTGGRLELRQGGSPTFPYVRRATALFPDDGPFRLTVGMQYLEDATLHGNGMRLAQGLPRNGVNSDPYVERSFYIHNDAIGGFRSGLRPCTPHLVTDDAFARIAFTATVDFRDGAGSMVLHSDTASASGACDDVPSPSAMAVGNHSRMSLNEGWPDIAVSYIRVDRLCDETGTVSSIVHETAEPALNGTRADATIHDINCRHIAPAGL